MKKNTKLKNRICAGFLALMLSGSPMTIANAEEQIVQEETQVTTQEQLVDYGKRVEQNVITPHLHKYVSEDGQTFKWICSEEPMIDGLKWTEETKNFDFSFESNDYEDYYNNYECPVEEYHQHLYGTTFYGSAKTSDDWALGLFLLTEEDEKWMCETGAFMSDVLPNYKTPIVVLYSKEEYEMMKELQTVPTVLRYIDADDEKENPFLQKRAYLGLSISNNKDHYLVNEKLMEGDQIIENIAEYPYMPFGLLFEDNYKEQKDYKIMKKTR